MHQEWIEYQIAVTVDLLDKISQAQYTMETTGRPRTILNVGSNDLRILSIALRPFLDHLREKEAKAHNPLLDVHTSEPVMGKRW